jgi:hypothetical protein
MESIKAVISDTYGKVRIYRIAAALPEIGNEWPWNGYAEGSTVKYIESVDADVAATSSGDPKDDYNFYRITVEQPDILDGSTEEFEEYMAIRKTTPQERYDRKMTKVISVKLNKGTDADILSKLEGVKNVQGYIKQLIRADITR